MSKGDGMSFAEFTYPLMQAWDWWYMYLTKGIQIQIGGSDQYGNITAGIDAIKYVRTHHPDPVARDLAKSLGEPMGFTTPLLTTSAGAKFGKSAGNAVWLDIEETSAFDLYGFFLRTSDADVKKYLKLFTFMPIEEIETLVADHMSSPSQRKAQHKLASEFLEMVHGKHEAIEAETQHRTLFQKPGTPTSGRTPDSDALAGITTINNKPKVNIKLPRALIYQRGIGKILKAAGIAPSNMEAHRLIAAGGAFISGPPHGKIEPMNDGYVSWAPIKNWLPEDTKKYLVHDDLLLFRKGKHNIRIVQVVSDEEYALSGEVYPGMSMEWRADILRAMEVKASITQAERDAIQRILGDRSSLAGSMAGDEEEAVEKKVRKEEKYSASEGGSQLNIRRSSGERGARS